MIEIEFYDGARIIKGILLGKYQCPHDEVYSVTKRFLWKTKHIYKHRTLNTPLYIIFVPWKHREKELVTVDEKNIINPKTVQIDEAWIKIDCFVSERIESYNDYSWRESINANAFLGYKFIYENNDFLINLHLHEWHEALTVLYQHMPDILDVDLENNEE